MIEVKNLVKKYGEYLTVDHLSFTVNKGEIYGFLGPNGAGKSTTMNIMTGYLGATEGEVIVNGHNILEEPEAAKKSIGYLPEIPPLYTDMTVLEYLCFVSDLKKIPKSERNEQINKVVELVKLEEVEMRLIKNLSKGYKQRVGLAQAILGFPEIIILDEPTVGLDPKQIIEIRELIRELAKEHTVILSSHILAEVREVCDYIMIISNGKLVASDTPENLEKRISGTEMLHLVAKADEVGRVENILEKVEYIEHIECKQRGEFVEVDIEIENGRDIREEVFFAFSKNECPLVEITRQKVSLEDVFLELTEEEKHEAIVEEEELEDESDL